MGAIKIKGSTSGSTTITAPATGSDETIELFTALAAKAPLASPTFTGTPALPDGTTLAGSLLTSGKILQVVRATDATERTTTSTSYVDASISVTITPTKNTSIIVLIWTNVVESPGTGHVTYLRISDNSDNAISGAEETWVNSNSGLINVLQTTIAYATPATTSATTYKGRFRVSAGTGKLRNTSTTAQLFAIEVSA